MPFYFYLVRNDEINAFAFFGGNIVLHSALFCVSDNESQAMVIPTMGMAALSSTLAGTQQDRIGFTQSNEQEADRIGIQVLQRAGLIRRRCPLSYRSYRINHAMCLNRWKCC